MTSRENAKIFGTPTEPVFNMPFLTVRPELLDDWLHVLAKENAQNVKQASYEQGFFKTKDSAEFIILTCQKFNLAEESKYLAIELFDKFMVQHVKDLHNHVNGQSHEGRKQQDWKALQERVANQIMLRALSCCQIASKLTSHYKILTPRKVRNTLSECGHSYSFESVMQSELRVLKTLGFNVSLTTPLMYIETLLEIYGYNHQGATVKLYYGAAVKFLDLYYMQRSEIYSRMFYNAAGERYSSTKDRKEFAPVEQDNMLLAVSLITAAAYIIDGDGTLDKVIEGLSNISRVPPGDILDFAVVLIEIILGTGSFSCS